MPKSKRDKKISLTKVSRKGLHLKQRLIENLQEYVKDFNSIYVFSFKDTRNNTFKEVKAQWKGSRIVVGKNTVIKVALGKTKEDEIEDGLHKLGDVLKGSCALLFTNCDRQETLDWFESFSFEEYARSGFKTDTTVSLKEGPLKEFSHTQEPYLRKLGMPVKLEKGVVTLIEDFDVCKERQILTPSQAKILELLDKKLANTKFTLKAHWDKETGETELFNKKDNDKNEDVDEEMETDEKND